MKTKFVSWIYDFQITWDKKLQSCRTKWNFGSWVTDNFHRFNKEWFLGKPTVLISMKWKKDL